LLDQNAKRQPLCQISLNKSFGVRVTRLVLTLDVKKNNDNTLELLLKTSMSSITLHVIFKFSIIDIQQTTISPSIVCFIMILRC